MDKFGGAFSQAKAYAEKGRTHVNAGFAKVDNQWQTRQRAGSQGQLDSSEPSSSSSAPPPPPPSRGSNLPPPAPASRSTTTSNGGGTAGKGGVFTNLSKEEKQAFFSLLDEYFSTRPHLSHLFDSSGPTSEEIENLSSFPRRGPLPTSNSNFSTVRTATIPTPPPVQQREEEGQWCTALYDYKSTDPDDLSFREGDRIRLIEVVSDDWWKGELEGRRGIFPSNYAQKS
ncbi:SH3 domain-containing protein [Sporobolomyces salmoneus]|uniref:SH3 domain-containing protein n=1 Tax=Sporobolomyces salmoneus TaxID=183962 RepID=UPI00317A73B0